MARETNLARYLFLCGLGAKNGFSIFQWCSKKRKMIFHDLWKLYEIQIQ